MTKAKETWYSERLSRDLTLCRWGEVGRPVLFFPTAAGDAEECERFLLVDALSDLLEAGRIKLYSCDSTAGMVWLKEDASTKGGARIQHAYDQALEHEVLPAIRKDCGDDAIELVVTGPSIGAFQALSMFLRHPYDVSHAILMSGTYDLTQKILRGPVDDAFVAASPMHFLPRLDPKGPTLTKARERLALIVTGTGRFEDPEQSWQLADMLGAARIPNRVIEWEGWDHDWPLWRRMLPYYLDELFPAESSATATTSDA
ncbi:MAG: hypothetical protein H6832_15220 [Planctomycetes bacterium]|nr:hypothetical protein [Planctomycetota bacterium]MCB9919751.1 hypothetical protein [Planctomycetota bacterium]